MSSRGAQLIEEAGRLRERALACKIAQEEGCFGCPAGVEFTPGVPAACKSVVESEMQVHRISLGLGLGLG